jgi:hypothetical protein
MCSPFLEGNPDICLTPGSQGQPFLAYLAYFEMAAVSTSMEQLEL